MVRVKVNQLIAGWADRHLLPDKEAVAWLFSQIRQVVFSFHKSHQSPYLAQGSWANMVSDSRSQPAEECGYCKWLAT